MLGRPPFSFYGRYTTKKKIPVENEPTRRRFLREPGEDTDSTCLLQRSVYTLVFRPSVTLLHVDLYNTFITNVLYGEAVKVSLYAIPESTSCNGMLAIKKAQNFYAY